MLNNIKPFYVYEENNSLFIKNINEGINKIANNIVSYCANFDDKNFIHICSIDKYGKLIHFIYKDGKLKRKKLCKVCHNVSNLKNMRLFIIKNHLNIFVTEESSLKDNYYRVSHYNFCPNNYQIQKQHFNNTVKKDESIYKLNIDDMSNIIFTYDYFDKSKKQSISTQTLVFNNVYRKWSPTKSLLRTTTYFSDFKSSSTIREDIFEYCYSIVYKKS